MLGKENKGRVSSQGEGLMRRGGRGRNGERERIGESSEMDRIGESSEMERIGDSSEMEKRRRIERERR